MKASERTRDASGRIVLVCGGCGKRLTLADRLDRKAYRIRSLLRRNIRPFNFRQITFSETQNAKGQKESQDLFLAFKH